MKVEVSEETREVERQRRGQVTGGSVGKGGRKRGEEKRVRKGSRGRAAFASANEIAPAIGGCLLAFDVRLVKCTG